MSHAESLTDIARSDAFQSVSGWQWTLFGVILGIVPAINVILFGVFTLIVSILTPNIDLSSSKRLVFYFQNPACYTAAYRKMAKRLRCMRTFYGWLAGVIILNCFF